jgi:hypothetical protein
MPDNPAHNPIPPGCRWEWDNWIQPPLLVIRPSELKVIQEAAALESLDHCLRRFLGAMEKSLRAEKILKRAIRRLRVADSLGEQLILPRPPWLVEGHVVTRKADHYSVFIPSDPTPPWRR